MSSAASRPDHLPPCVAYDLTRHGAAICRLHNNLPPTDCRCSSYSPDYGTHGPRRERWIEHLLIDQRGDLQSWMRP